jgi:hypothetical protein
MGLSTREFRESLEKWKVTDISKVQRKLTRLSVEVAKYFGRSKKLLKGVMWSWLRQWNKFMSQKYCADWKKGKNV